MKVRKLVWLFGLGVAVVNSGGFLSALACGVCGAALGERVDLRVTRLVQAVQFNTAVEERKRSRKSCEWRGWSEETKETNGKKKQRKSKRRIERGAVRTPLRRRIARLYYVAERRRSRGEARTREEEQINVLAQHPPTATRSLDLEERTVDELNEYICCRKTRKRLATGRLSLHQCISSRPACDRPGQKRARSIHVWYKAGLKCCRVSERVQRTRSLSQCTYNRRAQLLSALCCDSHEPLFRAQSHCAARSFAQYSSMS